MMYFAYNEYFILYLIFRLLCENTIERRIQEIQDAKLALSENVLTGSKTNSGSKLTLQDMCRLFDM